MPPYSPIDTAWPSVTELLDSDAPSAALWNVPLEAVLDGLQYVRNRLLTWQPAGAVAGGHGQKVNLNEAAHNLSSRWQKTYDGATNCPIGWWQQDVTSVGALAFEIIPPHAMARCARVDVMLDGGFGAGHGVTMPGQKPQVVIADVDGGTVTVISTTTDPSANVGEYDVPHLIPCPGPDNDPLGRGHTLWVIVKGEADGGVPGSAVATTLTLLDITCTWTSEDIP